MSVVVNDTTHGAATTIAKTFAQLDKRYTETNWGQVWDELSRRILVDSNAGSRATATDDFIANIAKTLTNVVAQITETGWVQSLQDIDDAFVAAAGGAGVDSTTIAKQVNNLARNLAQCDSRYTEANWSSAFADWSSAIGANILE